MKRELQAVVDIVAEQRTRFSRDPSSVSGDWKERLGMAVDLALDGKNQAGILSAVEAILRELINVPGFRNTGVLPSYKLSKLLNPDTLPAQLETLRTAITTSPIFAHAFDVLVERTTLKNSNLWISHYAKFSEGSASSSEASAASVDESIPAAKVDGDTMSFEEAMASVMDAGRILSEEQKKAYIEAMVRSKQAQALALAGMSATHGPSMDAITFGKRLSSVAATHNNEINAVSESHAHDLRVAAGTAEPRGLGGGFDQTATVAYPVASAPGLEASKLVDSHDPEEPKTFSV